MEVDNMEIDSSTKVAGHWAKRLAVVACEDGVLKGRAIRIDDYENTIFEGKTTGNGSDGTGQNNSTGPKSQRRSVTANDAAMSDGPKPGKADAICTKLG